MSAKRFGSYVMGLLVAAVLIIPTTVSGGSMGHEHGGGMMKEHGGGMMMDYSPIEKLGRGLTNIVTSPAEIVRSVHQAFTVKNPVEATFVGAHHGVGQTLARALAGLYDIVTFPFDVQKNGRAPIMKPEYVWGAKPDKESVHYA